MKKIKLFQLASILVAIHLFFMLIPDFLFPKLSNEYEAFATLFSIVALLYELPIILIQYLLRAEDIKHGSAYYFILTYLIGSIFYFLVGLLISYVKGTPSKGQSKEKNTKKIRDRFYF